MVNKKLDYFVVDVFTDRVFGGNPAGVCLLDEWLPDDILQSIAMENNLSETAFLVKNEKTESIRASYDLRWFTPMIEIDLCGHATMGSAYVLFNSVEATVDKLEFYTQSGILTVERNNDMLWMDLPSRPATPAENYKCIKKALGLNEYKCYKSADILIVIDNEEDVKRISPDFQALKEIKEEAKMQGDNFVVIVTAKGTDCDFVSRVFAPNCGVDEDPVTGRAHCVLTPYWSKELDKTSMTARQLSSRGGQLWCNDEGERVKIGGKTVLYLRGQISI